VHQAQRLINHVVLVLDASYSMKGKDSRLVQAADDQIKHLAQRSKELNQETRVSIYYFGETTIECLIFDMDVTRLPSIKDLYKVLYENTSLIDAVCKSQDDLATTSQLYGDHAFLTFVLTDGQENRSTKHTARDLKDRIVGAAENWSMGWLVPDQSGVRYLEDLGVLRDSIAVWDTRGTAGLDVAASAIRTATDNFMTARSTGVRGTKSVFSTSTATVNKTTVKQTLNPLDRKTYTIYPVRSDSRIDDFITGQGYVFHTGMGYYQLTKTETIQASKQIVVVDKSNGQAYSGDEARGLLGLPNRAVRVRPDHNTLYDIFVQSTSLNRKLLKNTKLLVKP
jgi:hypothetical protein